MFICSYRERLAFHFQRNTLIDGKLLVYVCISIFIDWWQSQVVVCQGCDSEILKFRINVNFDYLVNDTQMGKTWARCYYLFQCLFSFLWVMPSFSCLCVLKSGEKVLSGSRFPGEYCVRVHWGKSSQTRCLLPVKGAGMCAAFGFLFWGHFICAFWNDTLWVWWSELHFLCCGKSFSLNDSKTWACYSEKAEHILIPHKQCDTDLEPGQGFLWIELSEESVRNTLDSHGNPGCLIPTKEVIYLLFEGGNEESSLLTYTSLGQGFLVSITCSPYNGDDASACYQEAFASELFFQKQDVFWRREYI